MYKFKSRKIIKNLTRRSKRISKRIGKRLSKTIKNKTNKIHQFYKLMFKKFKGGCDNCTLKGG